MRDSENVMSVEMVHDRAQEICESLGKIRTYITK
jgi:hypothetical protein